VGFSEASRVSPEIGIAIAGPARAAMLAGAAAAHPNEACGLLFGEARLVAEASVAPNVADAPSHQFEIDPAHLFEAHRRARAGGPAIIGCWHSHPDGNLRPSARDAAGVTDRNWLWLIVAGGTVAIWRPDGTGFRRLAEPAPNP
jgi:proteasome lid subunit RPN8/RPN11